MYEIFEHTADLGLRIKSSELNTLFADAGKGFFSLIVENIEDISLSENINVKISGSELDYLFFDWLNELLYISETQHLVFSKFLVSVDKEGLTAEIWGEKIDPAKHILDHEVKAITYHGLVVIQNHDGWLAEVIVDI